MSRSFWFLAGALIWISTLSVPGLAQGQTCTPPESTFALLQRAIFEPYGCTRSYCHGVGKADGIDLREGYAYASLLHHEEDEGEEEEGHAEPEPLPVVPGQPERSSLWLKMAKKTLGLTGVSGAPMPIDGMGVKVDELEGLRLWILAGAPEFGFVDGVDQLIEACPEDTGGSPETLPACNPTDVRLMLPDLKVEPPTDVRVLYREGRRVVEFTTAIANVGDGPLIVQAARPASKPGDILAAQQVILRRDGSKCAYPTGTIRFADDGKHWAFTQMVNFELRKDDPVSGDLVAMTSKTSFCLLDTDPISHRDSLPHQFEAHCTDNIGRMGISVGYKDLYHKFHPGQWIDLDNDTETPVPPGTYYLVNLVNPSRTLLEVNNKREDNYNYVAVRVTLPSLMTPSTEPTETPGIQLPTPTPGPGDSTRPTRPPRPVRTPIVRPTRPERPTATPRLERPTATPRLDRPTRTPRTTLPRPTVARPPRPERPPRPVLQNY